MNTETDAIRSTLAHRVAELTAQNKVLVDALEKIVNAPIIYDGGGDEKTILNCEHDGIAPLAALARAALKQERS